MKIGTGVAIGVGAYLAYSAWAVANAVKQLRCSLTTVAYNKSQSSLLSSQLILKINIINPTRETVSFERFSGTVSVGTTQLATVDYVQPGKITPGENPLQIPVSISHLSLGANIINILKSLLSGKPITQIFNVVGNVYAGGVQLPITQSMVVSALSGVAGRHIRTGIIPSYGRQMASGRRGKAFKSNVYGVGCPDCITPNSSL